MNSRDFVYWLQGYFEITGEVVELNFEQVTMIRKHLALVFKHEIDPSMGPPEHQEELNAIHKDALKKLEDLNKPITKSSEPITKSSKPTVYRC